MGKCIDVELYRKQITLHLPFKHALMYFMNETADVIYKFNVSGGLRLSLILLYSKRFDLIDYPECLYFRYQTLKNYQGLIFRSDFAIIFY